MIGPARADFDFAIARVDAVADQKVVGEAVLHAALAMGGVVFFGIAVFDRAMVDDDTLPVVAPHGNLGGSNADVRQEVFCAADSWDAQRLSDADHVAGNVVGALEVADADAVAKRDGSKGVA